ncbi:MAG: hypothetical protein R3F59_29135 [Myxococcota bacterium]
MAAPTRTATPDEAQWVLDQLPERLVADEVTVTALSRDDGAAWFWVYPAEVEIGEIYTTWVVERTTAGVGTVSSFKSRRSASGDVTVP